MGPPRRKRPDAGVPTDNAEPTHGDAALSGGLLRHRVSSGVFFVGSWGVVNLLVGFGGNVILARRLAPEDFGIVAVGATLIMVATALSEGGLGNGLIRRREPPTRSELRSVLALQLTLTLGLATVVSAIGAAVGGAGLVVALMSAALPVASLQTPGRTVLARAFRFKSIAAIDATANLGYYGWAVAGVLLGAGVWALASAVVVRAAVATIGIGAASGLGRLTPSYHGIRALRPVIAFGIRFQAVSLAGMVREQGLNTGVAAIAGVSTLGFWTLAKRLLELPVLMFEPLHRVAFPLMSHVVAAREDPGRLLERAVAVAATASGCVLAATAAAAPELVPSLFGEQWRPVVPIVQWVCAALLVSGPVAIAAVGFLYAVDAPAVVLRATIVHTVVLFGVAFGLLPTLGATAIGVGSFAGAVVDMVILAYAVRSRTTARPLRALAPAVACAAIAGAAGAAATAYAGRGFDAAVVGGAVAGAIYVLALAIFRRRVLEDTAQLLVGAVRSGLSPEPNPRPAGEGGY